MTTPFYFLIGSNNSDINYDGLAATKVASINSNGMHDGDKNPRRQDATASR
ncbi:uncharacterized protein DS421_2g52760 [Arachis hypogaea]|nr:uncharacterized protein DS421_2g52760 [Arachis hypogaea]